MTRRVVLDEREARGPVGNRREIRREGLGIAQRAVHPVMLQQQPAVRFELGAVRQDERDARDERRTLAPLAVRRIRIFPGCGLEEILNNYGFSGAHRGLQWRFLIRRPP